MTGGLDVYQPTLAVVWVGCAGPVSRVANHLRRRVPLSNLMAVQRTGRVELAMPSIGGRKGVGGGRGR
jgi:hypothetical protein